jgi:hypothetical protein
VGIVKALGQVGGMSGTRGGDTLSRAHLAYVQWGDFLYRAQEITPKGRVGPRSDLSPPPPKNIVP